MGKVSCNCCTPKATDPSNLHRLAEAKLGQVANNPGICLNNLSIQSQSIFCSRDLGAWKCRILELENADPTSMKTPGSFFCLKSTWPKKDVPRWWVYELITSRCFITSSSKIPHSGHCFFLGGGTSWRLPSGRNCVFVAWSLSNPLQRVRNSSSKTLYG